MANPKKSQQITNVPIKPKWHGEKVYPSDLKFMIEVVKGTERTCNCCQKSIPQGTAHMALYKSHGVRTKRGDYWTVPWRRNYCTECLGTLIDQMGAESREYIAKNPEKYMQMNGIDPTSKEGKKIRGMHLRWRVENKK